MYDVYEVFGGIKHETFYIPGINYYFNAFTGSITKSLLHRQNVL